MPMVDKRGSCPWYKLSSLLLPRCLSGIFYQCECSLSWGVYSLGDLLRVTGLHWVPAELLPRGVKLIQRRFLLLIDSTALFFMKRSTFKKIWKEKSQQKLPIHLWLSCLMKCTRPGLCLTHMYLSWGLLCGDAFITCLLEWGCDNIGSSGQRVVLGEGFATL
jgi:hypothetical protein